MARWVSHTRSAEYSTTDRAKEMAEHENEIADLTREVDRLRDLYEPQIVDLRAVAPCGETMLTAGYDRNGRWVEVMVPTACRRTHPVG